MKWLQGLLKDIPGGPEPSELSPESMPPPAASPVDTPRGSTTDARASGSALLSTGPAVSDTPPAHGDAPADNSTSLLESSPPAAAEAPAAGIRGDRSASGSSAPVEDLGELIAAAINGAVERFEELAAHQAELGTLVRQHLQPPSAAIETGPAEPPAGLTPENPLADNTAIVSRLDDLADRQQELQRQFEQRIRSDEVQAKALERLHDELRQYKSNFIRQEMQPLLKEVIFCHDFVTNELSRLQGEGESGPEAAADQAGQPGAGTAASADNGARSLQILRQMLLDLLFKFDIEPFASDDAQFDPRTQQCTRVIPTEIAEQDKQVAEAGLPGFRSPETILRRQLVSVYKYKPAGAAGSS